MASSIIHNSRHFVPFLYLCNVQRLSPLSITFSRGTKHWNPKFKKQRSEKVLKVFLPNFQEEREDEKLSIEEIRAKAKEKGIVPHRHWNEKPLFIGCTSDIFEVYIPPEGDGKISKVTSSGMQQMYQGISKKSKSYMALRKIRNIDYEFDVPTVAQNAQDIYIEAQKALIANDEDKLHDLATEKAFPEMMENVKNKTLVWNFVQSLEAPRIVQIRIQDMLSKSNSFAQVTVRLHSQQTLAVYDRFGRLMHGSEETVKDVLEYIVFEKHLSHPHGVWRIHAKIIPDWLPPRDPIKKTYLSLDIDEEFPESPKEEPSKEISKEEPSKEIPKEQTEMPSLAT